MNSSCFSFDNNIRRSVSAYMSNIQNKARIADMFSVSIQGYIHDNFVEYMKLQAQARVEIVEILFALVGNSRGIFKQYPGFLKASKQFIYESRNLPFDKIWPSFKILCEKFTTVHQLI